MNTKPLTARSAHIGMLFWAAIVGLSFPAVGLLSENLPPLLLTAIRLLVAAAALTPIALRQPGLMPSAIGFVLYIVMGVALAGFFGAMFWAAHRTTALSMSTLYVSVPVLAYLLGRAVGVESRTGSLLGILVLGAVGALGLIWAGADGQWSRMRFGAGEVVYFLGCLASATYPVLNKLGLDRKWLSMNAEVRTFWSLVSGGAAVGAAGLAFEDSSMLSNASWVDGAVVVYLGLMSSAMTFWLTQRAAQLLTPGAITAYSYMVPFVSMLLLFASDLDRISWHWLPGSLIVTLAITMLLGRGDAPLSAAGMPHPSASAGGSPQAISKC